MKFLYKIIFTYKENYTGKFLYKISLIYKNIISEKCSYTGIFAYYNFYTGQFLYNIQICLPSKYHLHEEIFI